MGSTFTFLSHTDETKHVSVEIIIKSVATKTFSQNRKLHKTMYMYLWFPGPNSSYDITHSFFLRHWHIFHSLREIRSQSKGSLYSTVVWAKIIFCYFSKPAQTNSFYHETPTPPILKSSCKWTLVASHSAATWKNSIHGKMKLLFELLLATWLFGLAQSSSSAGSRAVGTGGRGQFPPPPLDFGRIIIYFVIFVNKEICMILKEFFL